MVKSRPGSKAGRGSKGKREMKSYVATVFEYNRDTGKYSVRYHADNYEEEYSEVCGG